MCTRANTLHNGVKILNKFQLELGKSGATNNTGEIVRRYSVGVKVKRKDTKESIGSITI